MTFSWINKTRRNRFSRLVADHFQSPKRRRSLVVETGFPTSLIDLYVRNRGRFRKSSVKKHKGNGSWNCSSSSGDSDNRRTDEVVEEDVVVVDSDMFESDCGINTKKYSKTEEELKMNQLWSGSNSFLSGDWDYRRHDEIIEEGVVVDGGVVASDRGINTKKFSKTEAELGVGMAKLNPVLVVLLKVLIMMVLVFGTKRFTIAITLSAFLLLFMESVGKQLSRRSVSLRPCVDSKQAATVVVCSEVLEIEQQVESKQEDRSETESHGAISEALIEIKHKGSRRAMMKSKIKKLVPKKLRKSSVDSKHELCGEHKEAVRSAQNAKPLVCSNECSEPKGRRSLSSSLSSETEGVDEEFRTDLRQNSDCLVLFFIVLVGLIGGRVFALVIALSWCLMLKLQWRNVKFPISRC